MNAIRNSSRLVVLMFALLICITGCKSKKKAMEASNAAERARLEQAAALKSQKEESIRRKEAEDQAKRDAEAREAEAKADRKSVV